ncbi:MAG: peptidase M22, partial [Clostridia bacterium]|nr:peptidase M22 [Clostridia bacterium]
EVKPGEKGLRQSDAVFAHVKNLPLLLNRLLQSKGNICAVGASARPRDTEGSYMPCFEAGLMAASSISSAMKIPFFEFSHQAGHIASALFSINRLDILKSRFIAFHVSGGTTEAVLCTPCGDALRAEILARSLDLKAGQAVDRVGQMLGLGFPAGPQLESLALQSEKSFDIKPSLKGADCCLSGIENLCAGMIEQGCEPRDVALFCIRYISASLEGMLKALLPLYRGLPLVFAGGVMSNTLIRSYFTREYGALFAKPGFSSDNAVGIAVLTKLRVVNE